jgi:predicted aspartyl protease
MRARLAVLGPVVLTTPTGADFVVQGEVKVVPIAKRQERVEIQWTVKTASGDERGRVVQLNEIPAGTLDHYWGDVAVVVATEASSGVNDVILRQSGHAANQTRQSAR